MSCTLHSSDDGKVRSIMCRRGFTPKPPADLPAAPPGPDLRPDFPLGQRVIHKIFGAGVVTRRRNDGTELGNHAEVTFEKHGKKEFCMTFAARNFKPADAP